MYPRKLAVNGSAIVGGTSRRIDPVPSRFPLIHGPQARSGALRRDQTVVAISLERMNRRGINRHCAAQHMTGLRLRQAFRAESPRQLRPGRFDLGPRVRPPNGSLLIVRSAEQGDRALRPFG